MNFNIFTPIFTPEVKLLVFLLFLPACSACAAQRLPAHAHCATTTELFTIQTSYGPVSVDRISPSHRKTTAALFAVHGSAGLLNKATPAFDNLGEYMLACAGFNVYIPHYFDLSGIRSTSDRSYMAANSGKWLGGLIEIYDSLLMKDGKPHFLLGQSLGGYLALSLQAHVPHICGIALVSVGLADTDQTLLPSNIPVLNQSGDMDTVVPVSEARELDKALAARGDPHSLIEYPDAGHNLLLENKLAVLAEITRFVRRESHRGACNQQAPR